MHCLFYIYHTYPLNSIVKSVMLHVPDFYFFCTLATFTSCNPTFCLAVPILIKPPLSDSTMNSQRP